MATLEHDRAGAAPWLLSGPALLLFGGLLLVPLVLTLVLSFHAFSDSQGTLAAYTLRITCASSPTRTTAQSLLARPDSPSR
jgi:putative spermidine/putrescine transport system permease protein